MTTLIPFMLLTISLFLLPDKTQGRYREMKTCGPGRELRNNGDGWKCKRCRDGFYSDSRTSPCIACRTCRHRVRKHCTRKQDTVCHARPRRKQSCTRLLIFGRYKRFKKHCKNYYTLMLKECQTEKKCWWRRRIPADDDNTIPKFTLTKKQTTTVTDFSKITTELQSKETSTALRTTAPVYHAAYVSTKESAVISLALPEKDTQYEESELPPEDKNKDFKWYHCTGIIVFTFVATCVIFAGSFLFYKKIKLRHNKARSEREYANSGSVTTIFHHPYGENSESSLNDTFVPAKTGTELVYTGWEQKSSVTERQVSDISPNQKLKQVQDVHCNGQENVEFKCDIGKVIGSFQRSMSVDDCQIINNMALAPTSNTLPLTKKEKQHYAFGQFNSKRIPIWSVALHTDVQKHMNGIISRASFFGSSISSVLFQTSEDTIRLCKDKDLSMTFGSVQNNSENICEGRHDIVASFAGVQASLQDKDSSLGLSITDESPVLSNRNSNANDFDSVNMISDSGVEDFGTEALEVPLTADSCITVSNNQAVRVRNNYGGRCTVNFTDNLHIEKPKNTRPENIFENLFKSEGTQTQHNAENTRSIYGHPWSTLCHFTREGGKLTKPTSDIVLDIPQDAVPDGETVFVQGLFTVDYHGLQCHLREDEVIVSPIAEFQMSYMQQWAKFVKIILPCVHRNPRETFRVRFYQRNKEGDIEHGDVPLYDPSVNQELYYVKKANHVEIFTIHFTGFYCSVCGHTLPLELNAMVFGCYGIHDNEAWISLHIADRRSEIRDFKHAITEEEKTLRQTQLFAQEEIRLVDQSDCHSRLEFNLMVRKDPHIWDTITGTTKQIRRLQELVKCSCPSHVSGHVTRNEIRANHTCHHKLKWVFKPVGNALPASFSCKVHVEHVLSSNSVTERHDDCEEGITDIPVPPIYLPQQQAYSMPKPPLPQEPMAFPEIPCSRKPMFSRGEDSR